MRWKILLHHYQQGVLHTVKHHQIKDHLGAVQIGVNFGVGCGCLEGSEGRDTREYQRS